MADDQQRLARFLDRVERDERDGVTIRSLHNRLSGHIQRYDADQKEGRQRYDADQREHRDRLTRLETKAEATERQHAREELADAIAEGTGRHQVPPSVTTPVQPFPVQPFTPAFGTVVPTEVRAPEKKHSGFWSIVGKGAVKAALKHGGTALGAAAITLLVSWLAGRGCVSAQAVEKIEAPAASGR